MADAGRLWSFDSSELDSVVQIHDPLVCRWLLLLLLPSPTTRALMERDMLVRKFQKENLEDLFAVIRQNPSGMDCLARFAEEQRMGGEVGFFMEVEGERWVLKGDSKCCN